MHWQASADNGMPKGLLVYQRTNSWRRYSRARVASSTLAALALVVAGAILFRARPERLGSPRNQHDQADSIQAQLRECRVHARALCRARRKLIRGIADR